VKLLDTRNPTRKPSLSLFDLKGKRRAGGSETPTAAAAAAATALLLMVTVQLPVDLLPNFLNKLHLDHADTTEQSFPR
jgi:hypothetical protein